MNVRLDSRGEQLVEEQLRAGRFQTAEEVVAQALEALAGSEGGRSEADVRCAVQDMLAFPTNHPFTLGGLGLRQLIDEGRKH